MKRIFSLKIMVFLFLTIIIYIVFQKPPSLKYEINIIEDSKQKFLIDDFLDKIDNDYWNVIEKGENYNNELQYYTLKNIKIQNNNLKIYANKEIINNYNYTSGSITTKSKFEFLYGKVIFKAKPAIGKGLLSAVWLLPSDGNLFPEIDIIEILGEKPQQVWSGIHYIDNNSLKKDFNKVNVDSDEYSIYELHWNKNEIKWFINNKLVHQTNKGIPDKKMYLIINLSVGGDWPKDPVDEIFPADFLIDYMVIIPNSEVN